MPKESIAPSIPDLKQRLTKLAAGKEKFNILTTAIGTEAGPQKFNVEGQLQHDMQDKEFTSPLQRVLYTGQFRGQMKQRLNAITETIKTKSAPVLKQHILEQQHKLADLQQELDQNEALLNEITTIYQGGRNDRIPSITDDQYSEAWHYYQQAKNRLLGITEPTEILPTQELEEDLVLATTDIEEAPAKVSAPPKVDKRFVEKVPFIFPDGQEIKITQLQRHILAAIPTDALSARPTSEIARTIEGDERFTKDPLASRNRVTAQRHQLNTLLLGKMTQPWQIKKIEEILDKRRGREARFYLSPIGQQAGLSLQQEIVSRGEETSVLSNDALQAQARAYLAQVAEFQADYIAMLENAEELAPETVEKHTQNFQQLLLKQNTDSTIQRGLQLLEHEGAKRSDVRDISALETNNVSTQEQPKGFFYSSRHNVHQIVLPNGTVGEIQGEVTAKLATVLINSLSEGQKTINDLVIAFLGSDTPRTRSRFYTIIWRMQKLFPRFGYQIEQLTTAKERVRGVAGIYVLKDISAGGSLDSGPEKPGDSSANAEHAPMAKIVSDDKPTTLYDAARRREASKAYPVVLPNGREVMVRGKDQATGLQKLLAMLAKGDKPADQLVQSLYGNDTTDNRRYLYILTAQGRKLLPQFGYQLSQLTSPQDRAKGMLGIYHLEELVTQEGPAVVETSQPGSLAMTKQEASAADAVPEVAQPEPAALADKRKFLFTLPDQSLYATEDLHELSALKILIAAPQNSAQKNELAAQIFGRINDATLKEVENIIRQLRFGLEPLHWQVTRVVFGRRDQRNNPNTRFHLKKNER